MAELICAFPPPNLPSTSSWGISIYPGLVDVPEGGSKTGGWHFPSSEKYSPITEKILQDNRLLDEMKEIRAKLSKLEMLFEQKPLVMNTDIRDLGSEKYTLKEKIGIIIEEYPEEVLAKWPEVELFGRGTSSPEAIQELKNEIIDLYKDLSSTEATELGKLPEMWLRILNKIIK